MADLDWLISRITSMAKDSQDQRLSDARAGRFEGAQWVPQSELDERRRKQALMDLEAQKQTGELDKQRLIDTGMTTRERMKNAAALDVQGLRNTGVLAEQKERNTGELARQGLINTGSSDVANISAGASRYGHELTSAATVKAHEIAGQASRDVANINLGLAKNDPRKEIFEAWSKSPNPDEKTLAGLTDGYNTIFGKQRPALPVAGTPEADAAYNNARASFNSRFGSAPVAAPAPITSATPARIRGTSFDKPDTVTPTPEQTSPTFYDRFVKNPSPTETTDPEEIRKRTRSAMRNALFSFSPSSIRESALQSRRDWENRYNQ